MPPAPTRGVTGNAPGTWNTVSMMGGATKPVTEPLRMYALLEAVDTDIPCAVAGGAIGSTRVLDGVVDPKARENARETGIMSALRLLLLRLLLDKGAVADDGTGADEDDDDDVAGAALAARRCLALYRAPYDDDDAFELPLPFV